MQGLIELFTFRGRLGRGAFWALMLMGWLAFSSLLAALAMWTPAQALPIARGAVGALATWYVVACAVRRLHDRALSARCLLAVCIPVLGGLWLFWQLAILGTGHHARLADRSPLAWRPTALH